MPSAFLVGVAAGYGVAIPVGAIAVLIIQTGVRRGFVAAAAAGGGAATADLLYAYGAVVLGAAVLALLDPIVVPMRLLAAAILALMAFLVVRGGRARPIADEPTGTVARTYAGFVLLTLLNPTTIAYFVNIAIGLPLVASDPESRLSFAVGAFLASLSWQTLLAAFGAALHARVTPRVELATRLLGGAILLAFAARIASDALSG